MDGQELICGQGVQGGAGTEIRPKVGGWAGDERRDRLEGWEGTECRQGVGGDTPQTAIIGFVVRQDGNHKPQHFNFNFKIDNGIHITRPFFSPRN